MRAATMSTSPVNNPIDPSHSCKTPEDCVMYYDNWAKNYDKDVVELEYRGPEVLHDVCIQFVKNKDAKVLDFLCGTGNLGRLLQKDGYTNIDGIDGSENMLAVARETGCYQHLFHEILLPNKPSAILEPASYDAVATIGVFSPGHMNAGFMNHIYQPVKVGGLAIFGIREPWIAKLNIKEKCDELQKTGIWRLVDQIEKPNYREKVSAIFFIFEKL